MSNNDELAPKMAAVLRDAVAGSFARVTIEGETWVKKSALDAAVAAERAKWEDEVAEISNRLRAVERIQGLVRADERERLRPLVEAAERFLNSAKLREAVMMSGAHLSEQQACDIIEDDRLGIAAALRARGQGGADQ
jgi:hypothetical protein